MTVGGLTDLDANQREVERTVLIQPIVLDDKRDFVDAVVSGSRRSSACGSLGMNSPATPRWTWSPVSP
jgi:hypothetical protein